MRPFDLIDTSSFPIDAPESAAYAELVQRCRTAFTEDGMALLAGFLTELGVNAVAAEAIRLQSKAFFHRGEHNVYLDDHDPTYDPDHLRNRMLRTDVGSIANDYLAPDGALQQLYELPALTRFIADVVDVPALFLSDDPLGAVSVNVFEPGDAHAWHFDESRFSVTVMVQPAEQGGHFEYVRGLREAVDGDVIAIGKQLDEPADSAPRMPFAPGTLSIFAGRHTLHRVTRVRGSRARLVPVLTYSEEPGYRNSDAVRQMFWGRVR